MSAHPPDFPPKAFRLAAFALSNCGHVRGNGTRLRALAIRASLRPLDIRKYVFGSQSCATRLSLEGSVPLRPRTCPRLAFSSALGAPSRPSSLAPAPQSASPAPFIADSRRLALSLAFSLSLVGLRSSPCAAPRRACREPNSPASLSSLIEPRRRASLVPHEANAPHVLPGAHTGFSPQRPARLALGKKEDDIRSSHNCQMRK